MPLRSKTKGIRIAKPKKVYKSKSAPSNSTHMQLWFNDEQIGRIERFKNDENDRRHLHSKENRLHRYNVIPMLVDMGLEFRKNKVYVPEDLKGLLLNKPKFLIALLKAEKAMEEVHKLIIKVQEAGEQD